MRGEFDFRQFKVCLASLLLLLSFAFVVQSQTSTQQRPRRAGEAKPKATPTPTPQNQLPVNDDEVVRVETNLTNVLLTAVDKDKRYVTTLNREDLRIYENDKLQEIFTFQRETDLPLSIAVVIDTSKSQQITLPEEKNAAFTFLDSVMRPNKDIAAVVSFTGISTIEQSLTNDKRLLRRAIDRVKVILPPENAEAGDEDFKKNPIGYSGIWDSIWETVNKVMVQTPERTRRAIILLSDGDDTSSQVDRDEAADLALKNNVIIYTICIGDDDYYPVKEKNLRKLAERTGGKSFRPKVEGDVLIAFKEIEEELRSQYLVAYSPTNTSRDGSYRRIRIEIVNPEMKKQKLKLFFRQGYFAK